MHGVRQPWILYNRYRRPILNATIAKILFIVYTLKPAVVNEAMYCLSSQTP